VVNRGGVGQGGACSRLVTTGPAASGDALIQSTLINTIILDGSGDAGPDGVACTADDLADPAAPTQIVLTTETADGLIYDSNRNVGTFDPTSLPLSGASFDPAELEAGTLDATLVTAFPALSTELAGITTDAMTSVSLACTTP
jgi:hypothetical protein